MSAVSAQCKDESNASEDLLYAGSDQVINNQSFPRLGNPPSVEAVLELRVRLASPMAPTAGEKLAEELNSVFTKVKPIRFVSARISFDTDTSEPAELASSVIGSRLESEDGMWVVQAKSDSLAVSRLAPYETWETLVDKLKMVWPAYRAAFAPEVVTRIGARFINKIAIGPDPVDLDDLLTTGPRIPASMPQAFLNFASTVIVPLPDLHCGVTLTQSSELLPLADGRRTMNVLLDIDAFAEEAWAVDDFAMWERLSDLRIAKNRAFFGALKPTTLERFK